MGRKRDKGKWAAAAISAPKITQYNTLSLSKIISEHIDDAARIR
jgi:hypothetical protein